MELAFWQAIVEADCAVPAGYTAAQLTPELVGYLGSTDARLRDDIAFSVLATWLDRGGVYDADEMRALAAQMAANLSAGLGECGTDTVFRRTFSALILGKVIDADNARPFLTAAEVHGWLDVALHYLGAERDLRGYVPGKGWAHATAHTADLLLALVRNRYLGAGDLARILDGVAARLTTPVEEVYHYLEDERLAYAVMVALHRDLLEMPYLTSWVERLARPTAVIPYRQDPVDPRAVGAYLNARQFLRTLYLQLEFGIRARPWEPATISYAQPPRVRPALVAALREGLRALDPGFYARY